MVSKSAALRLLASTARRAPLELPVTGVDREVTGTGCAALRCYVMSSSE